MTRLLLRLTVFILALSIGLAAVWTLARPSQTIDELKLGVMLVNIAPPPIDVEEPPRPSDFESNNEHENNIESFTDYRRIGRPKRNKIEIRCFDRGSERVAQLKFFSRNRSESWEQKQSFEFRKDDFLNCDPQIKDFDNDGLGDFTYQSNVAARGANEVRKLFIYDKKRDELVYIKNSEDYPNLAYNKKLDCVDAWLFHATTTTVFLRIEGDILREFAQVDTGLERVVTVIYKNGKSRVVRREKMNPNNFGEIYRRFSSYNPPK